MEKSRHTTINKTFIISFSMSNYLIYGGGTNLVVSNHQKLYNSYGVSYICIAPFLLHGKRVNEFKDFWSLIIDGKQIGVLKTIHIIQVIERLKEQGARPSAIHIHHWKETELNYFQQIMNVLDGMAYMFIHDYYTICNNHTLLHQGKFCGYGKLSDKKCDGCEFYLDSLKKTAEYKILWNRLQNRLKFIFPSEVAQKVWTAAYPEFKHLCTVIPHQCCIGKYNGNLGDAKNTIRVAFVGSKEHYKGWDTFLELYKRKRQDSRFVWFYFGTDKTRIGNMHRVYVDNTIDPMAMMKALRINNIDIAVLWSLWKETYSYTYFECFSANVFIVTNSDSGNIAFQVEKNGNGMVVESEEELFHVFDNDVIRLVNSFKRGSIRGPEILSTNQQTLNCSTSSESNKKIAIERYKCDLMENILCLLEKYVEKLRKFKNIWKTLKMK